MSTVAKSYDIQNMTLLKYSICFMKQELESIIILFGDESADHMHDSNAIIINMSNKFSENVKCPIIEIEIEKDFTDAEVWTDDQREKINKMDYTDIIKINIPKMVSEEYKVRGGFRTDPIVRNISGGEIHICERGKYIKIPRSFIENAHGWYNVKLKILSASVPVKNLHGQVLTEEYCVTSDDFDDKYNVCLISSFFDNCDLDEITIEYTQSVFGIIKKVAGRKGAIKDYVYDNNGNQMCVVYPYYASGDSIYPYHKKNEIIINYPKHEVFFDPSIIVPCNTKITMSYVCRASNP